MYNLITYKSRVASSLSLVGEGEGCVDPLSFVILSRLQINRLSPKYGHLGSAFIWDWDDGLELNGQ